MASSFLASLQSNIERVENEIDAKCFFIFKTLAFTVVHSTPVLRGNLINDFWPSSNSYNYTCQTRVDAEGNSEKQIHSDVTGSGSISRIREVQGLGTFKGEDGFLSWSTSVPYAHRIEYDGWSSRKAPAGFMRVSLFKTAQQFK